MYVAFLVIVSVFASQGVNLAYKKGSERTTDPISSPPLMCCLASVFLALLFAIIGFLTDGGIAFPNRMSIVYGICLGLSYAMAAFFYLLALSSGPYTISAILLNLSSFMPILYSRIFLSEEISLYQLIGLVIIIVSCVFLTLSRSHGTQDTKVNPRWIIFAVLTFFSNSFISFFIRVNTVLAPETSRNSLFVLAYSVSIVICLSFFLFTHGVQKQISPKPLVFPATLIAISLCVQLIPTAILPQFLSAALQYPLEKGFSVLLSVLIGSVFFKERIGKIGFICIGAIIGAMCLLGIN